MLIMNDVDILDKDRYLDHFGDDHDEEGMTSSKMFVLSSASLSSKEKSLSYPSMIYSVHEQEEKEKNRSNPSLISSAVPPPLPPRTPSSSSFLQETKELLDLISIHHHLDVSSLVSEV